MDGFQHLLASGVLIGSQGLEIGAEWLTPPACGPADKHRAFTYQPRGNLPLFPSNCPFMLVTNH